MDAEERSRIEAIIRRHAPEILPPTKTAETFLLHRYHLRPGTEIGLELPPNFTQLEAWRLCSWILALPFVDGFRNRT